ncbi:hypothetical protein B4N89_46020 [Embleya scabrispora]|uniref:Uncharacterized protein n=1 Tax=Embleya scabrispora TaxID=159449 RepID=A0A1T3NJ58_9ACTN|nr:hypothetical protein [Embleya scabrispora]OPC76832.1 hypothetical protein B4N89_46020 [Embleya scabrispora]
MTLSMLEDWARESVRNWSGPRMTLAYAEGRLRMVRECGYIRFRVYDNGGHGNLRQSMVATIAQNYGVDTSAFSEDFLICRHGWDLSGPAGRVARAAVELPAVLAAAEHTATIVMRLFGRWVRDSAHGQEYARYNDVGPMKRQWRRRLLEELARLIGPDGAPAALPLPDWSTDWRVEPATLATCATGVFNLHPTRNVPGAITMIERATIWTPSDASA